MSRSRKCWPASRPFHDDDEGRKGNASIAVIGAPNPFFQCGFEAQQIGSFKVGAFTAQFTAATDDPIVLTSLSANETIREVP